MVWGKNLLAAPNYIQHITVVHVNLSPEHIYRQLDNTLAVHESYALMSAL